MISKKLLLKEYVKLGKSQSQIAKENNYSQSAVSWYLKKYGIDSNKSIPDLTNKQIARWKVLKRVENDNVSRQRWLCRCECGTEKIIVASQLIIGNSLSCGCLRLEKLHDCIWKGYEEISGTHWREIEKGATSRKISFNVTIEYAWELFVAQKRKCVLSGRDIAFASVNSQKNRYKRTASLDRIDSNIGYEVGNVQWVHKQINMAKQRLSVSDFKCLCNEVTAHCKDKDI